MDVLDHDLVYHSLLLDIVFKSMLIFIAERSKLKVGAKHAY